MDSAIQIRAHALECMMSSEHFTEYELHAYIDGELKGGRKQALLKTMETDKDLAARVCGLQRTKQWVKCAFENIELSQRRRYANRRGRW